MWDINDWIIYWKFCIDKSYYTYVLLLGRPADFFFGSFYFWINFFFSRDDASYIIS